jgi:hypothetical protein
VVVDDGSTDGSVDVIRRYADRLAWWTQQQNAGQPAALNRGFAHTTGELLGFVNSDDTLLPGAVSAFVKAFGDDRGLLLVCGDALTRQDGREIGTLRARDWDPPELVRTGINPVPRVRSRRSGCTRPRRRSSRRWGRRRTRCASPRRSSPTRHSRPSSGGTRAAGGRATTSARLSPTTEPPTSPPSGGSSGARFGSRRARSRVSTSSCCQEPRAGTRRAATPSVPVGVRSGSRPVQLEGTRMTPSALVT